MSELKTFFETQNCNLIFLQEVSGLVRSHQFKKTTDDFADQLEHFSDSIWSYQAYGKNAAFNDGHHGNAILSEYEILDFINLDLSLNRMEKRGLLHAKVFINNRPLHLITTHLNLSEKDRSRQLKKIIDHIDALPVEEPLILGGDFNDWTQNLDGEIQRQLGLASALPKETKTFPSFLPLLSLDRIYFRGLKLVNGQVIRLPSEQRHSHHLPVLAEFDIS